MIRSLFLSKQELDKGAVRPVGVPKSDPKKVTVIGAGMMGAGIAYVQALAGIETILIDRDQDAADKGKAHVEELLKKRLSRGQMDQAKYDALLASVTATTDYDLIKGSDLVIEAVFENREIKADVTKRAEAQLAPGAVWAAGWDRLAGAVVVVDGVLEQFLVDQCRPVHPERRPCLGRAEGVQPGVAGQGQLDHPRGEGAPGGLLGALHGNLEQLGSGVLALGVVLSPPDTVERDRLDPVNLLDVAANRSLDEGGLAVQLGAGEREDDVFCQPPTPVIATLSSRVVPSPAPVDL